MNAPELTFMRTCEKTVADPVNVPKGLNPHKTSHEPKERSRPRLDLLLQVIRTLSCVNLLLTANQEDLACK